MKHPPLLGIKVNKVAFGPATGKCSDQIVNAIISDFVSNKIEVVDRADLTTLLSEHNFTLSGYVDKSSAVAMGKIIGPSVLIFVKVQRCATEQQHLYNNETKYNYTTKQKYEVTAFYSKTTAYLKASIQAVDLATGRIFVAQTVNYSPSQSNKSYQGYPEFPSDFDVQDIAINDMVAFVHRMFLPWTEIKNLFYFDDKKCGLKQAYQALRVGNLDEAFNLSQKNLEKCKNTHRVKKKILGHAYYNMGMSYMIRDDYDKALENFREANKFRPGDIVTDAINICQKAKALAFAMQQVDKKAEIEAAQQQAESNNTKQVEIRNTLTNKDIIELTQKKLPNALIIEKIKTSNCKFDTSTDALLKLTKAHVSNDVIIAMMNKK